MGPKGGRFDPGGSRHAGELKRPARSEAHEGIGARLDAGPAKGVARARKQAQGASKLGKAQGAARARKQAQGARRGSKLGKGKAQARGRAKARARRPKEASGPAARRIS